MALEEGLLAAEDYWTLMRTYSERYSRIQQTILVLLVRHLLLSFVQICFEWTMKRLLLIPGGRQNDQILVLQGLGWMKTKCSSLEAADLSTDPQQSVNSSQEEGVEEEVCLSRELYLNLVSLFLTQVLTIVWKAFIVLEDLSLANDSAIFFWNSNFLLKYCFEIRHWYLRIRGSYMGV